MIKLQEVGPALSSNADADPHPCRGDTPQTEGGERADENVESFPFFERLIEYRPCETITVERVLDLTKDLHLADHAFVHAPGVKPLSACLPVLPMTLSLEAMAEVAACLVPGFGLIGFEDIKATRWIEISDTDRLTLRVMALQEGFDPLRETYRISAAIRTPQQVVPAISGVFLFARRYRLDLCLTLNEFSNQHRHSLTGEEIYQERHLFHGASYQCLSGAIILGEEGAFCEMVVPSPSGLFRDNPRPQLLTDPQLLDAVGQLIGVWAMARDRYVFPIGMRKLELYRPTPSTGTRVSVRVEIKSDAGKTLEADIEVLDGGGAVWMRIEGWRMWKFRWDSRFVEFRRMPARRALSEPFTIALTNAVCRLVATGDISGFDTNLLARYYLHIDEMPEFVEKAGVPQRQRQWLLGRVAAKDAVRAWLARLRAGELDLHPASLVIAYDSRRQPIILGQTLAGVNMPKITIAHCADRAIAIAHESAVGVDIERINPRDASFAEAICTTAERQLLDKCMDNSRAAADEWLTRLWSAKEAAGKETGTGVNASARRFEAIAIGEDGVIDILSNGDHRTIRVTTLRNGNFIVAYTSGYERLPI
jgi:phosphopantetheinyl transferase